MILVRRVGWERALIEFIGARRHAPYVYGRNDCCTFVRDAILAMTGTDVMPGIKPPTSRIAGARFLLSGGYGDVEGLATKVFGPPLAAPLRARRGDVVSFEADDEMHLAISVGVTAATPAMEGLARVPLDIWRNGWKVG